MTAPTNPEPSPDNPYPGPPALQVGDPLFGRDQERAELRDLLVAHRIVLLYSPSGAGKSSLLEAGLRPDLEAAGFHVLGPLRVGLAAGGEADAGNPYLRSVATCLPPVSQPDSEAQGAADLEAVLLAAQSVGDAKPTVLVFDQFEEILTSTLGDDQAQKEFLLQVGSALRDRSRWAIFAMREDYIAALDPFLHLIPTRLSTRFRIDLLRPDQALEAIMGPAASRGRPFDADAAEALMKDLRQIQMVRPGGQFESRDGPFVEPLHLQLACRQLWAATAGQTLIRVGDVTSKDRSEIGGVARALAGYYDTEVAAISSDLQVEERRIRVWFDTQLIVGDHRGQTLEGPLGPAADDDPLMQRLVGSHLVRANARAGAVWYELAHDRLIEPISRSDRDWRRVHGQPLQVAAMRWHETKGPLLTGDELLRADSLDPREMSSLDVEFLAASRTADRQRRRRRSLGSLGLVVGLAVIAIASAGFVVRQRESDDAQGRVRAIADRSGSLASRSLAGIGTHLDRSLLLADEALEPVASLEPRYRFQARNALLTALLAEPVLKTFLSREGGPVYTVAFSPDGRTIASGSSDGAVVLWDLATGQPLGEPLAEHRTAISSIAFSPDGTSIASGSTDGTVVLWDVATRRSLGEPLTYQVGTVTSIAFSPDGTSIAVATRDGKVTVLDVATHAPRGEPLVVPAGFATNVAFSPDGRTLASGTSDGALVLWDMGTGLQVGEPLVGHKGFVTSIAFSPDGTALASGTSDGALVLWDMGTGLESGEPLSDHGAAVTRVAFDPDGTTIASGRSDGTVILWDVASRRLLGQLGTGLTGAVYSIAFSPDGRTMASGGRDGTVLLWDMTAPPALGEAIAGQPDGVTSIAVSPDGTTIASGGRDGTVLLWDSASREPSGALGTGLTEGVYSIAFSPDGTSIAIGSRDGKVAMWDVATRERLGEPLVGPAGFASNVAFSPDGRTLASGSSDGTLVLWDVGTGRQPGVRATALGDAVTSLAFSPDGHSIASGGRQGTVVLWDAATLQQLGHTPAGHDGAVSSVAFSPDGRSFASGGRDGTIILWDAASRTQVGEPLVGQAGSVTSVAISPDGTTLASGSTDGTVMLWDAANLLPLGRPLRGHRGVVTGVAFSGDGTTLASGGLDGTVMLWDVGQTSWRARSCARANRNLSDREWRQYMHDQPYRKTCPDLP